MKVKDYVKKVTDAIEEDMQELSLDDYLEALEEIQSYVESSIDAAKDDLKRRDE